MSEVLLSEAPHRQALKLLIDQNVRDRLKQRYGLLNEVVSWFKAIEIFYEAEFQQMIEREPTELDQRHHRTWLIALIAEGEQLVTEIQEQKGLGENYTGIKLADVEATLEELRTTHREWYDELTEDRKKELWKGVFNVEESGN